jgi:hypothetical protein
MLKKYIGLFILPFLLTTVGCTNDKPHPETNTRVIPVKVEGVRNIPYVEVSTMQNQRSIDVKHQIKANDVYVECIVSNFTFTKDKEKNVDGEGHIELFLNGEKVDEISTAAFIIKELPFGNHTIRLELVHNNSMKYNISQDFKVSIPK